MTVLGWRRIPIDENHHVWQDLTTGLICGDSIKDQINSEIVKQIKEL